MPLGGRDTSGAVEDIAAARRCKEAANVALVNAGIARPRQGVQGITTNTWSAVPAVGGAWMQGLKALIIANNSATAYTTAGQQNAPFAGPFANSYSTREHANVGDYTYGITGTSSGALTGDIVRWDGANGLVYQNVAAPRSAISVANYANRLFVAGGSVPGTTTPIYSNRLYFTDPGGPPTDNLNEWKDDISGLVNQIVLDGGEPIRRLVTFDRALYIIRSSSIYRLTGSGPSSFVVTKVLNMGCPNTPIVTTSPNGIVFTNFSGVYEYDGTNVTRISENCPDILERATINISADTGSACQMHGMSTAYLLPQIPAVYGGPGGTIPDVFFYNHETRAWTVMQVPTDYGTPRLLIGWNFTTPSVLVICDTGAWQITLDTLPFDFFLGDVNQNQTTGINLAKSRPMLLQTGVYRLATPQSSAQLHRVMVDYTNFNTAATNDPTFTCTVRKEDGTAITSFTLPAAANGTRQRIVVDAFHEVTTVYLEFTIAAVSQADWTTFRQNMAVHDAWLEYSVAAQRRAA